MTQMETGTRPAPPWTVQPRLRRSTQDRMIAGVCGGLGRHLDIDPLWLRLGFVAVTLAGGAGILVYLIAWIVIPKERADETVVGRPGGLGAEGLAVLGVTLVGVGLMLALALAVPWFGSMVWPLTVVAAGVGLIYMGSSRR